MLLHHHGVAMNASVSRNGHTFVASVRISGEDGKDTTLCDLGYFASRASALFFAVRCGKAFADGEPMPVPPCKSLSDQ
jgi:hypothetical protein